MKKLLFIFFIIILFLVFVAINNSNPKIILSKLIKPEEIQAGELRYKIYLLGIIPIGEAFWGTIKTEEYNGRKVYHLNARADTLKVFSQFFRGQAILDSYIDTEQLAPILFKQKLLRKDDKRIDREAFYDQKNNVMTISGVKRHILPDTQDPLSAVLNIRRMDFAKVRAFQMNINTNQKNYALTAIAQPKDISINKKIYKVVFLKAEIRRRDNNPYHQSKMTMILLNGKENIPILIKIFAGGFLINAKLIEIK